MCLNARMCKICEQKIKMNTKYIKCLQETSNEVFVGHEETVVTDTVLQM